MIYLFRAGRRLRITEDGLVFDALSIDGGHGPGRKPSTFAPTLDRPNGSPHSGRNLTMKFWPFGQKLETRAAAYTDAFIEALINQAGSKTLAIPGATASLEMCASLVGRGFLSAEISGRESVVDVLVPDTNGNDRTCVDSAWRNGLHDRHGKRTVTPIARFIVGRDWRTRPYYVGIPSDHQRTVHHHDV